MQKVSQTGVGTQNIVNVHTNAIAVQVAVTGTVTFQVNARVSPEAPWMPVIASGSVDVIQSLPYYPELQLSVTAGTGTATMYSSHAESD